MKIRIIGGGPAGLFFAYLMGRANTGHDIRVYERDPEGATYGWGLVFSDVALSFVREVAPEVYDSVTAGQVVFGDMEIIGELYNPDICFLPIGDYYTMSPREAAYAVDLLDADAVVPMHYGTFPILTGTPAELQALVGDDVEVASISPGDTLS